MSATGSPPSPLLVLAVALAVAGAVGCGGGSDSSSSNATAAQEATATTKPSAKGSGASAQAKPAAKGQGSAAGGKGKPKPSIAQEEKAPGDHSIQEYGVEAAGSEKEDVLAAMHSFLVAMAAGQEVKVCAGLGASVRVQLGQLAKAQGKGGSCTVILARLLNPAVSAEASRAVNGTIGRVRVGGGNALVLFRPQGGKLSYFVMKEEGGAWKATSMGAGAQLSP